MFHLGFATPNSFSLLFFNNRKNTIVHPPEKNMSSFLDLFENEINRWGTTGESYSVPKHSSNEKKKTCSLPQGISLIFLLHHRCPQPDQIDNNNIQWQNGNKNRFCFQHEWNDALSPWSHSDRWFILRLVSGYSYSVFEESNAVLFRSYADLSRATWKLLS